MKPEHKRIFHLLADWQLLALCIEREASGEPREGRIAVATVVLERVDHRKWDGNTIRDVILMPWQFSWTMPECGADYYQEAVAIAADWVKAYGDKDNDALRECASIATGMLQGTIPRDPDLAAVHCCQYMNPKTAQKGQEDKLLAAGMKIVKNIEHHRFYA